MASVSSFVCIRHVHTGVVFSGAPLRLQIIRCVPVTNSFKAVAESRPNYRVRNVRVVSTFLIFGV